MKQLWFTTEEFKPLPAEEEKINPGRFGESLATWVQTTLADEGYTIEGNPTPEDWGWVVMLQRKPFSLWVGCGNEDGSTTRWSLFVEAERGIFSRILSKADPAPVVKAVEIKLEKLISEAGFKDVEWMQS